jgi:hypothetical protein
METVNYNVKARNCNNGSIIEFVYATDAERDEATNRFMDECDAE